MKNYEFEASEYELSIERKGNIRCKVWEANKENSSIVVFAYGYGENIDNEEIESLANNINKSQDVAVIVVEYAGTDLKYSDDLLQKLEERLPRLLDNIIEYVPESIKELIKQKQYQDAINALYFNAYVNYPITKDTVISLYGDENNYNDFGLAPALDIIYSMIKLKKIYTRWNWNDCIGYGKDYGAYLIEMVERIQPGTFSMILNVQGDLMPKKEDLFYNYIEWEKGGQKNAYIKKVGRFPIYLVDVQGWTTDKNHPNHFKPWHFDIRNLLNENIIKSNYNLRETPRIYVDLYNLNKEYLIERKKFIDILIEQGYSVEYFLVEEKDIENYIFSKDNNSINISLEKLFSFYFNQYLRENNRESIDEDIIWYPVCGGVYVIYEKEGLPAVKFLSKTNMNYEENKDIYEIIKRFNGFKQILEYIENPIEKIDDKYLNLID